MDHVAIMNPPWFIDKILAGEKRIETRWYKTRRCPWGKVGKGDIVWFKESGGPVRAKAVVSKVEHFSLPETDVRKLVLKYAPRGMAYFRDPEKTIEKATGKKYAIFMWLESPEAVRPFSIDKRGFGSGAAWLCVDNMEMIINERRK